MQKMELFVPLWKARRIAPVLLAKSTGAWLVTWPATPCGVQVLKSFVQA